MKAPLTYTIPLLLLTALLGQMSFSAENGPKCILFIAGEPSHGWNKHEFPAGCELLAKCLDESGLNVQAQVSLGWPEDDSLIKNADTIVIYSDGNELHVALGKEGILQEAYQNGSGIVILHYALEPGNEPLNEFLTDAIGGYFEVDWSVNPVWTLENSEIHTHEITQGIEPFNLEDEWYYHMRFQNNAGQIASLIEAVPPESSLGEDGPRTGNPAVRDALKKKRPQSLAWAKVDSNERRGFGFTGGHFHHNWSNESVRKLVLNGIAWTAGLSIPEKGIESEILPIVKYQSIEQAIALGDLEDLQRHIANDPEIINRPGRGSYTPLHQAILRKKGDIVSSLIKQGADPNVTTKSKQTALHLAVSRSDVASCLAVIAAGADLSLKDGNGWTPLHLAAAKNKIDLVTLLLENGADISILSDAGGTPLHEASVSGSKELIELLLSKGVDPSVVSKTGETALDHAIEFKNEAGIRSLTDLK